jgi:hypothetical protein
VGSFGFSSFCSDLLNRKAKSSKIAPMGVSGLLKTGGIPTLIA